MTTRKSYKWIDAYENARKMYSVEKSKAIANKTIKKRKPQQQSNKLFPW